MKIAIIGGGISGLTTAFYLKKYSPSNEITIFESDSSFGGKLKTVKKYGFAIEIGGNGFLSNKVDTFDLIREAGLKDLLMESSANARKRYIYDNGKLHLLPESPREFLNSNLLNVFQKLRVAMELFVPPKRNDSDETLQQFGYRRVGKGMTNVFLDAMTAGVFASTPEKISANAAFPMVVNLEKEYGGLLRGMIAKKKKETGPGGVLMSFKGGVSTFIEALAKTFDFTPRLNAEVTKVEQVGKKWLVEANGKSEEFDKVVIATPSYVASRILKESDEELSELLKNIEYSPVAIVALGYDNLPHQLDGFGLLTTKRAGTQVLGILWDSSIFPDRAEDGKQLLRVLIGGQRQPLLALKEEEELLNIATGGISETMGVYAEPLLNHIVRWHKAIPNYALGHIALVNKIFDRAKNLKGLHLNSNAYKGVSFNDCVKNSKETALKIISE
ncbi:MAG: protoporphyrinogen oxidase [Campylobacterales bacterium]|nr:protoporphyrinogen oxidase [Campylobacterales bacterium]